MTNRSLRIYLLFTSIQTEMRPADPGAALRANLAAWRDLYTRRHRLFLGPEELRELVDLGRQLAAIERDYSRAPSPQIRQEAEREASAILALMERYLERLREPGQEPPVHLTTWTDRAAARRPLQPRSGRDR